MINDTFSFPNMYIVSLGAIILVKKKILLCFYLKLNKEAEKPFTAPSILFRLLNLTHLTHTHKESIAKKKPED